ncbi:MAG: hypothetical protein IPL50_07015 [Chitinophagaceae bacterium]|nr:hypothetical protein [Chitinophagaceae bacterium]
MTNFLIQLPGYLAFVFLAISLLVNNDIKFRWINSLGGLCFVFYGILINAFPIILTNAVLFSINIFSWLKYTAGGRNLTWYNSPVMRCLSRNSLHFIKRISRLISRVLLCRKNPVI